MNASLHARRRLVAGVALVVCAAACFAEAAGAFSWKHDREPPSTPSDLHATSATPSSITFAWTASTDNVGVTSYEISVGSATPVRMRTPGYTASGLACATALTVDVIAFDRAGNRSTPATATASTSPCPTTDMTPPSTPTDLAASGVTQTAMTLSWTASHDDVGVTGYDVYQGSTHVASPPGTSYAFAGLSCDTTYTLYVDAFDAAANISPQASLTVRTAACPTTTSEPAPIAGLGYHQAFHDDFDTLNRNVWDNHIWYDIVPVTAWTNFQYAQNGVLHLVSSRYFLSGATAYPSNTITTQTSGITFTSGYFEARMKWLGGGHGAWPAFWLFSFRHATNPAWPNINPYCASHGLPAAQCLVSELDIADEGGATSDLYVGLHRDTSNQYGQTDALRPSPNWFVQGVDLSANWHTYAALWTSRQVSFYLDDRLISTVPVFDSTNQPMFMLLQNWTNNGCWGCGATNGTDTDTQIDYVQVWQQ